MLYIISVIYIIINIYNIYILYIFIINLETWLWVYEFAQFAFAQFAHVVTLLDDC